MKTSVFLQEDGDTPKNRVWSFLIVHSEYDYSMKDIARFSKVGYTTLKELWKEFREKKIIIMTREVGKAKMYKLNTENLVVQRFIEYYWAVVSAAVKRENGVDGKKEYVHSSLSQDLPVSATHFLS
ncbi:hypothetical protein HYU19_04130 [Candidatus Woesearchaeota archaeon]|nr:hypothetical protein [Candidatus Woesearchaeota archaeon]